MINVSNEITVYERNGQDSITHDKKIIEVKSHWNRHNLVVIRIDNESYTVDGGDLREAIKNAQNVSKY